MFGFLTGFFSPLRKLPEETLFPPQAAGKPCIHCVANGKEVYRASEGLVHTSKCVQTLFKSNSFQRQNGEGERGTGSVFELMGPYSNLLDLAWIFLFCEPIRPPFWLSLFELGFCPFSVDGMLLTITGSPATTMRPHLIYKMTNSEWAA